MAVTETDERSEQQQQRKDRENFDPDKVKNLPAGQSMTYDAKDDPFTVGAPPRGWFRLKLFAQTGEYAYTRGWRSVGDDSTIWYGAGIECKVQDPKGEYQDYSVFSNVTTRVQAGKKISTMGGLIARTKYRTHVDGKTLTELEMFQLFRKFLIKEPVLWGLIDWQGYSKNDKIVVFPNYESFPTNGDGSKQHLVLHRCKDGSMEEIQARARIIEWRAEDNPPTKEELAAPKKKTMLVGGSGGDDDLDAALAEESGTGKATAAAQTAAKAEVKPKAQAKPKPKAEPKPEPAADDLSLDDDGLSNVGGTDDADLDAALD